MYACREWFEGYKVAYTGADLIALARMVMEREREHEDACPKGDVDSLSPHGPIQRRIAFSEPEEC